MIERWVTFGMEETDLRQSFEAVSKRRKRQKIEETPALALKRYMPLEEDYVVGVVEERGAEAYKVDLLGATIGGTLGALAFDGATKRNRPNLQIGDAVFCRVLRTTRGGDAALTCCAKRGSKKEWMTGAASFGKLAGGKESVMARCSPPFAKKLLERDAPVLHALAKHVAYEVAVGLNGVIWVRSGNTLDTIIAANAIENSEHLEDDQIQTMVDQIVAGMHARTTLLCYEKGAS